MYDLILRDATLVTGAGRQVADVAIKGGRIAYVGPRPRRDAREEISAIGKFLMPGVIDSAVHFEANGDPELWERESRAAVTGGITSIVALPDGERPVVDAASARARAERAIGRSWCEVGLWIDADRADLDEVAAAVAAGHAVGAVVGLRGDEAEDAAHERLAALLGAPGTLAARLARDARDASAVQRVAELARRTDRRIHLIHLSTAEELAALDPVLGEVPVTAGVSAHHLFLSAETVDGLSTLPPVRPEQDRRTLWTAMKRGRLDCVASDHHPHGPGGEPGVPSAELMFPLLLSAVRFGRLSLERLVSLCSEAPARILGLPHKGRIEAGADADLVLFSEGELTRVAPDELLSSAGWSPYTDRETATKPDLVMVRGVVTARAGRIVGDGPQGRALRG